MLFYSHLYSTLQGLKNCVHAGVRVRTVYAKALELTRKSVLANFGISLISRIFEIYFTEIFYCSFIETCFVVHLQFFGDTEGACFHFFFTFVFKSTKFDRFKFVNSVVFQCGSLI